MAWQSCDVIYFRVRFRIASDGVTKCIFLLQHISEKQTSTHTHCDHYTADSDFNEVTLNRACNTLMQPESFRGRFVRDKACVCIPAERQSAGCRMKVYLVILIRNIYCNGKKK